MKRGKMGKMLKKKEERGKIKRKYVKREKMQRS
jgi:hypothetical protein